MALVSSLIRWPTGQDAPSWHVKYSGEENDAMKDDLSMRILIRDLFSTLVAWGRFYKANFTHAYPSASLYLPLPHPVPRPLPNSHPTLPPSPSGVMSVLGERCCTCQPWLRGPGLRYWVRVDTGSRSRRPEERRHIGAVMTNMHTPGDYIDNWALGAVGEWRSGRQGIHRWIYLLLDSLALPAKDWPHRPAKNIAAAAHHTIYIIFHSVEDESHSARWD